MERGWPAKDLLLPLWGRLPRKRESLAELTGISAQTLSAYNSGSRNLGEKNARRIAAALEVSLLELGAPEEVADDAASRPILDRLAALEAEVARLKAERDFALREVVARLARLEAVQVSEGQQEAPPSSREGPSP